MITTFAIPRPDGQYLVGKLDRPQDVSVRRFAPEEAVVLTAEAYERVKDSPYELRRAVIGEPNPLRKLFRAVHLVTHPVDRAMQSIDKIGSQVASWVDRGKPDSISANPSMPESLTRVRDSVRDFGGYLSKKSTKRAFLDAPTEKRDELRARLEDLKGALRKLSGMRFVGGEMNDLFEGVDKLNTFMVETNAGTPLSGRANHIGDGTIFFGKISVDIYQIDLE